MGHGEQQHKSTAGGNLRSFAGFYACIKPHTKDTRGSGEPMSKNRWNTPRRPLFSDGFVSLTLEGGCQRRTTDAGKGAHGDALGLSVRLCAMVLLDK